jgi:hypothetical protein
VLPKVVGPAETALVRYHLSVTTRTININEVLEGHVSLEVHCADRLLLNAYVPKLQVAGVTGSNDEREQTLDQILTEMDGFGPTDAVIVLRRPTGPRSSTPPCCGPDGSTAGSRWAPGPRARVGPPTHQVKRPADS